MSDGLLKRFTAHSRSGGVDDGRMLHMCGDAAAAGLAAHISLACGAHLQEG